MSQSERAERHREAIERLLQSGAAYRDPATGDDVKAWKEQHGKEKGYRGCRARTRPRPCGCTSPTRATPLSKT